MPKGEQTFDKVKFKIGDGVIQLGSKVLTEMPEKVEDIKVGRKFARLHILHATGYGGGPNAPGTAWHVEDDTPIGEYTSKLKDMGMDRHSSWLIDLAYFHKGFDTFGADFSVNSVESM